MKHTLGVILAILLGSGFTYWFVCQLKVICGKSFWWGFFQVIKIYFYVSVLTSLIVLVEWLLSK